MGVTPSQELNEDGEFRRPNSMRRSSSNNRLSKSKFDQITASVQIINNLKSEIDIFAGDRESPRYKQFQEILTAVAKEIQVVKTNSKKQTVRDHCDEILGDVQNCLQRLETRVNFNLQNENSLDLATVESHSFINHGFNQKSPPPLTDISDFRSPHSSLISNKVSNPKLDHATALENLQRATSNIEHDIRIAIETENSNGLVEYENRIKMLYAELEMVRVDERSQLHEKKIRIGKKLIKSNNQIKMLKKRLDKNPTLADSKFASRSSRNLNENKIEIDELSKIEHLLEKHEIEVLTFDGLKDDKKYKNIEQHLESYWTKVYSIDALGSEEKRRKTVLVDRIKNILQELRKRAEGNRAQNSANQQIQNIMEEVQNIKGQFEVFKSSGGDKNVLKFDQELRSCWAKLSDVKEVSENVKQNKQKLIAEIQHILITLSKNGKSEDVQNGLPKSENLTNEKEINNDILQNQLLKQVEEFQNHWNHLNYNLNVSAIQRTDTCDKILDILQKITKEILEKRNDLLLIQKNQSEAKIKAMEDKVNYYNTPDLIEQQTKLATSAANEKEIKAQPTVKTIGEIQRIGAEAKVVLQQIRQSDCKRNDKEYNNFEINLKKCRLALESIEGNKKSETISNSKQRVIKTIAEGFRVLQEKKVQKTIDEQMRSSKAQEIMDIDAEIQYFRQQIKTFTEVTKNHNYDKIKNGLNECLNKLQLMDDMHIPKQDSIRQIQQYHQELETKLAENQAKVKISAQSDLMRRQSSQNLKLIIEQVQKLKSQVEKFTGVYKGLHYKQLEENILTYLNQLNNINVQSDDKLENAVLQTKQKIQKYLNILEDKSIKTMTPEHAVPEANNQGSSGYIVKQVVHQQKVHSVSLEDEQSNTSAKIEVSSKLDASQHPQQARKSQLLNPNSPHHKINSLRDELVEIKDRTENFSGKYKDDNYSAIENKLLGVYQDLQKIKDEGHKSVIMSKEQYGDYIEKLLQYFENKTKIAEDLQNAVDSNSEIVMESSTSFINSGNESSAQTFTINDPLEELGVMEEKTASLKIKISHFAGSGEDNNYKILDQEITQLMTQLNKLETGNVAHVREKKRMIGQELHICGLMLERQAMSYQEYSKNEGSMHKIEEILSELEDINKEVMLFNGVKNDNEYCYLDEVLIKLTIKLDDINVNNNPNLKLARKNAIQQIQENMQILTQRAESKSNF